MYEYSERFWDIDGSWLPITQAELAEKLGDQAIIGDGITLKPLLEAHAPAYYALVAYDRAHLSQFGDQTAEKYKSVEDVRLSITEPENPFKLRFGIWHDNTIVGTINLMPGNEGEAEIGYFIGKQYTGNRYSAKALNALSDFAFSNLGYEQLKARIEVGNKASQKIIRWSGFEGDSWEQTSGSPYMYRVYVKQKPTS